MSLAAQPDTLVIASLFHLELVRVPNRVQGRRGNAPTTLRAKLTRLAARDLLHHGVVVAEAA